MKITKIGKGKNNHFIIVDDQDFKLAISSKTELAIQAALLNNLVVLSDDDLAVFYLGKHSVSFVINKLSKATLYYMKQGKGQGWICFEVATTTKDRHVTTRVIGTQRYREVDLDWITSHKSTFESALGLTITVQDCGYDC